MRLLIGLGVVALMSVAVFGFISARLILGGWQALLRPALIAVLPLCIFGLYEFGFLDNLLWYITMPASPAEQSKFVDESRGELAHSAPCATTVPVKDWVGQIVYAYDVSGWPAVAIKVDAHIVLRSAYLPGEKLVLASRSEFGTFSNLEGGNTVRISGTFLTTPKCPDTQAAWHYDASGDSSLPFKFSGIKAD